MGDQATVEDADVLIVGAGPSGAVAAFELSRKGFKVVCLEQGEWNLPDDFTGDKPPWELARLKQWHASPNTRGNEADYPINAENSPLEPLMFNGVGGSTILYSGHWVRALPVGLPGQDPRRRGRRLAVHLRGPAAVLRRGRPDFIGVSGLDGDPAYPEAPTPSRCRRCRSAKRAARRPRAWTSSAGTGGRAPTPSPRVPSRTGPRAHAVRHLRVGLPRPAPRPRPT